MTFSTWNSGHRSDARAFPISEDELGKNANEPHTRAQRADPTTLDKASLIWATISGCLKYARTLQPTRLL